MIKPTLYLSPKSDKVLQEYINSFNGKLAFRYGKCRNKDSKIKIHYKIFQKFNNGNHSKFSYLDKEFLETDDFVFRNGVIVFELTKTMYKIMGSKQFKANFEAFKTCVEAFIEHTYINYYFKCDDALRLQFYSLCDEYYSKNKDDFEEIALKESKKNLNISAKHRDTFISIDGRQNKKINNMKEINEKLLEQLLYKWINCELKSKNDATREYNKLTNSSISFQTFRNRMESFARLHDIEFVQKKKILKKEDKQPKRLTDNELCVALALKDAGYSYDKIMVILKSLGLNISRSTVYKQINETVSN